MDKIREFFVWWANLTGTKTKWYRDGKLQVSWPVVSFWLFITAIIIVVGLTHTALTNG